MVRQAHARVNRNSVQARPAVVWNVPFKKMLLACSNSEFFETVCLKYFIIGVKKERKSIIKLQDQIKP
jgi:hypothetical protein